MTRRSNACSAVGIKVSSWLHPVLLFFILAPLIPLLKGLVPVLVLSYIYTVSPRSRRLPDPSRTHEFAIEELIGSSENTGGLAGKTRLEWSFPFRSAELILWFCPTTSVHLTVMPENGPGSRPGPYLIQLDGVRVGMLIYVV